MDEDQCLSMQVPRNGPSETKNKRKRREIGGDEVQFTKTITFVSEAPIELNQKIIDTLMKLEEFGIFMNEETIFEGI